MSTIALSRFVFRNHCKLSCQSIFRQYAATTGSSSEKIRKKRVTREDMIQNTFRIRSNSNRGKMIGKQNLAEIISRETKIDVDDITLIIEEIFQQIRHRVLDNNDVIRVKNFGYFSRGQTAGPLRLKGSFFTCRKDCVTFHRSLPSSATFLSLRNPIPTEGNNSLNQDSSEKEISDMTTTTTMTTTSTIFTTTTTTTTTTITAASTTNLTTSSDSSSKEVS